MIFVHQRRPDFNNLGTRPINGWFASKPKPCFLPREPRTPFNLITGSSSGSDSLFQRFNNIWTICSP